MIDLQLTRAQSVAKPAGKHLYKGLKEVHRELMRQM
jgi:hypothetical protein